MHLYTYIYTYAYTPYIIYNIYPVLQYYTVLYQHYKAPNWTCPSMLPFFDCFCRGLCRGCSQSIAHGGAAPGRQSAMDQKPGTW